MKPEFIQTTYSLLMLSKKGIIWYKRYFKNGNSSALLKL
jgi:hypothetical protein